MHSRPTADRESHWIGDGFRALPCSAAGGILKMKGRVGEYVNRTSVGRDRLRSAKSYHAKTSPSAAMNSAVLTGLLRGKGRHDTRSGPRSLIKMT